MGHKHLWEHCNKINFIFVRLQIKSWTNQESLQRSKKKPLQENDKIARRTESFPRKWSKKLLDGPIHFPTRYSTTCRAWKQERNKTFIIIFRKETPWALAWFHAGSLSWPNLNLVTLAFQEGGEPEDPGKNSRSKAPESTTNSTRGGIEPAVYWCDTSVFSRE